MTDSNYIQKLHQYRSTIDEIDNKIISYLIERKEIVKKVKELKEKNGESFFIKSSREADMIRNLIKTHASKLDPFLIAGIWRKIITYSNMIEQDVKIALFNPLAKDFYQHVLSQYYLDNVSVVEFKAIDKLIKEVENKQANIVAFELKEGNDNQWLHEFANNKIGLKVFAKIPFIKSSKYVFTKNHSDLMLAAVKEMEKSESDISLVYIESDAEISKDDKRILHVIKISKMAYLVELDGFFDDENEMMKVIQNKVKMMKIIGCYPKTIEVKN